MADLTGLGGSETQRQLPINKQHLLLENLVPALLIKDPFSQDLISIPFNHIMSFEYSFHESQGQAVLEIFDPSSILMPLLWFNVAQAHQLITIRWGWTYNTESAFNTPHGFDLARVKYMTQPYDFLVLGVDERQTPAGSHMTINMASPGFHPTVLDCRVAKTFVSSRHADVGNKQDDFLKQIQTALGGENSDEFKQYKKAIDVFNSKRNAQGQLPTDLVSDPNRPGIGVVQSQGALTFQSIYNSLINIANDNQGKLGPRQNFLWQRPFLILPDTIDDEYDYGVFEGRNESVWQCLNRLFSIMVSKDPGTKNTADASTKGAQDTKKEHRMVGGKFSMTSCSFSNPAKNILIHDQNNNAIKPDNLATSQKNFFFGSFIDAPYEYMINTGDTPVAYYVFFGGSKKFDIQNTTEIIEFEVQADLLKDWYTNSSLFTITKATNPDTNASTQLAPVPAPTDVKANTQTTATTTADSTVSTQGQTQSPDATNPSRESSQAGTTTKTSQVAAPSGPSQTQEFNIPFVVSQTGELTDTAVKRFLDILRTKAGQNYPIKASMTIVGDARWEATYVVSKAPIHITYVNRDGSTSPLYSGVYNVMDIKHRLETGKFLTVLSIQKQMKSVADSNQNSPAQQDAAANKNYGQFDFIPVAQITITLKAVSSATGGVQTYTVSQVSAFKDNVNNQRVTALLKKAIKGKNAIISDDIMSQATDIIKNQTLAEAQSTLSSFVKAETYEGAVNTANGQAETFTTNFVIKDITLLK